LTERKRLTKRRLLLDWLTQALRSGRRETSYLAVLFIEFNKFKQVNDNYGRDTGGQMRIDIASRLPIIVRESDTVAMLVVMNLCSRARSLKAPSALASS
jgi:diguanylate cyclase (GGDEF)-like protein